MSKTPTTPDYINFEWRTGRYRTWQAKLIYAVVGDKPTSGDPLIGQMRSARMARFVVEQHNGLFD